mgnify:CR=1 FL=1
MTFQHKYNQINDRAGDVINSIDPAHVTEYDWLVQNINQLDTSQYRRRYSVFWRLNGAGLSQTYREAYFSFLRDGLNNNALSLNELAHRLYLIPINTNRQALQFSFCTKLCHMLDRNLPIYDSQIRKFYDYAAPLGGQTVDARIADLVNFHSFLVNEYKQIIAENLLYTSIQAFRHRLSPQHFTDIKVVDSLIWAFVNYQES